MSLRREATRLLCQVLIAVLCPFIVVPLCKAQRPFTVADDIALTYFGDPFFDKAEPFVFSPDGKYFAVHSERGRLDINRPESSLRIYRTASVKSFLHHAEIKLPPAPIWSIRRSTYKDGPVITTLRWLSDSSGFGFLSKTQTGTDRLFLADIATRRVSALTPKDEHVTSFDIRDRRHYVYTALSSLIEKQADAEDAAASVVGTDRKMTSLLSPSTALQWHDLSDLWAVVDGKRSRVMDASTRKPLPIHWRGQLALALSPDGHTVLTVLTVPTIPREWETLYVPPYPASEQHITSRQQDPFAFDGWFDIARYVLIDLDTNTVKPLPLGPLGYEAGWIGLPYTDWSKDGKLIALTDTFLDRSKSGQLPIRPCAVVVDLRKSHASCVETVFGDKSDGRHEDGFHLVNGIKFDSKDRVLLKYEYPGGAGGAVTYLQSADGTWTVGADDKDVIDTGFDADRPIRLSIRQSMKDPPVLVATDGESRASRVIWDPNPWLKDIELGDVSAYHWKDKTGRELIGGLYKPPHYAPGKRYPLVIQTHGFSEADFVPSGIYPTGFAARELAASGFVVLQVRGCPIRHTPGEGSCQVEAYESAVNQLVAEGIVDPGRIGIVGFSRTCYYALQAIATSAIHFAAASITNGMDLGYMQYLAADKIFSPDSNQLIGAPPFGKGLGKWIERSPEFNMDKVTTPLLVVGVGQIDIVAMWEPYATLWHQDKPVDLILLKEGTHPLTNPAQRLVSQGSTVDWMRFWLNGEEDPDPSKAEQYNRWHRLRELHAKSTQANPAM